MIGTIIRRAKLTRLVLQGPVERGGVHEPADKASWVRIPAFLGNQKDPRGITENEAIIVTKETLA